MILRCMLQPDQNVNLPEYPQHVIYQTLLRLDQIGSDRIESGRVRIGSDRISSD